MRIKIYFILHLFLLLLIALPSLAGPISAIGTVEVFFSPRGGATEAIVKEIGNAKKEILVQAYSFTSAPIASALVSAKKRGVIIEVVLDKSQRKERYTSATFVANAGIPTYIDGKHAIAHNKIMTIDQQTLITGSFNFSKAAEEKNAENLIIMKGNDLLIKQYIQNFNEHKGHSEVYQARY